VSLVENRLDSGDTAAPPHRQNETSEEQAGGSPRSPNGRREDPPSIEAARADGSGEELTRLALQLIEETNDIISSSGNILLAGQSKVEARKVLSAAKECVVEMVIRKIPQEDEILVNLRKGKSSLQRLILQADSQESAVMTGHIQQSNSGNNTATSGMEGFSGNHQRSGGSRLQYTLAMKQLQYEIERLNSPKLIDVGQGSNVKPDVLKDLLKITVPEVRKSVDRARDALKTLSLADEADEEKIMDAQEVCEKAIKWVSEVEDRCKDQQLHLEGEEHLREIDFAPFQPGTGVSIYEFFSKFESWSRGMMSLEQKANVLYNKHLDPSVLDGNKDLEERKEDYSAMKLWLQEKWGTPDAVCEMYLENISKLTIPSDPRDDAGMLLYTKNAYSNLMTLTKLECDRGKKVSGLQEVYHSNTFLKRLHKLMPKELGAKFLFQMQENDENYFLMKGPVYLERIISLYKCAYKSLEISLDESSVLPETQSQKETLAGACVFNGGNYTLSSGVSQEKKSKRSRGMPLPDGPTVAVAAAMTVPPDQSGQLQTIPTQKQQHEPLQFAPNLLSRPLTYVSQETESSLHQTQHQPTTTSSLKQSVTTFPSRQFCRGPRWACPVKGHTGHDLAGCQEFWGAQGCAKRRQLIFGSGCSSCLGKDQGCQDGRCDIIYQLPPDVMCEGCVKSCLPGKSPSNKMTCDITWHRRSPDDVIVNAMEAWVPNLNIGRLVQNLTMSVNMFGMSIGPPRNNDPLTDPEKKSLQQMCQQAELTHKCVPINHVRRISKLEAGAIADAESRAADLKTIQKNIGNERKQVDKELANLRKKLSDQEDLISELRNNFNSLRASCKTADVASQTDPWPSAECEALGATSVFMQDAGCNTESYKSEPGDVSETDQSSVLQHIEPKRKRKPRKNRSRGARRRAKAAKALALSDADAVALTQLTEDDPVPATDTIPAHPVAEADDRNYILLPKGEHSSADDTFPLAKMPRANLFQGFYPPVIDPYRLSRWFLAGERDTQ
jgi:hypothetical protein